MSRRIAGAALFVSVVSVCFLAAAYSAERLLQRRTGHSWLFNSWDELGPTVYDPLLGWTNVPSTRWPDLYGPGKDAAFNARGFRSLEEHTDAVPPGRVRILCLGDSFVDGLGVGDSDTFPAQMERAYPQLQAVNMAKISYGLDQAALRYERDAADMEADIVLLAAIDDNLNRARWDRFNGYWPKPRFRVLPSGEVSLTGIPVPDFSGPIRGPIEFAQRSALFLIPRQYFAETFYDQNDEALAYGILDRLNRLADERRHRVVLAYLPTLAEALSGEELPLADLMERYATERAVEFINTAEAFRDLDEDEIREMFLEVNEHYSERGNRLVAETIVSGLGLRQ